MPDRLISGFSVGKICQLTLSFVRTILGKRGPLAIGWRAGGQKEVIGGTYVGDITHYFVVVHSRSIKLEESSSSGGGRGQERAIGGFSVCKNFNPVNKTGGVWALGKKERP